MKRLLPFALVLVTACSGTSDDSGTDEVTFTKLYDEVFSDCAVCHGPGQEDAAESGLTIHADDKDATYAAMVDATAASGRVLVAPGDIDGSYLVTKVLGEQDAGDGSPMPPPFGLDAASAAMVVAWVEAGAPNN